MFYQRAATVGFVLGILLFALPLPLSSQETGQIESEIDQIEREIGEARKEAARYDRGLVLILLQSRIQTLELSKAILENRRIAESGGATIEITVPAVIPNAERAAELLAEIEKQTKVVERARAEARKSGGLVGALALSTALTEELTLSQLRMAWFQAAYGIAFPTPGEMPRTSSVETADAEEPGAPSDDPWVDSRFPDIDYSKPVFSQLHEEGFRVTGWWGVLESKSEIDDSPSVLALNVSEYGKNSIYNPSLMVQCREGEGSIIFDADKYLLTDFQSNSIQVTLRIDDEQAQSQSWSKLTSNEGAGLFGARGESMIRRLYKAERIFLRVTENNGTRHDSNFPLAGARDAFDTVAAACGFSILELDRDDYRAIQSMLNAAGFDAGSPDGVWGGGSKRAMEAYQKANGLAVTGAPDRPTLEKMGLSE